MRIKPRCPYGTGQSQSTPLNKYKNDTEKQDPEPEVFQNIGTVSEPTIGLIGYVERKNWILEKMADKLIKNCPSDLRIILTKKPIKGDNAINLHWPYRSFVKTVAKSISFHTHPEKKATWDLSAKYSDHIITMCDKYTQELIKSGVPESRITKIIPGIDPEFTCEFTIFFPCDMKKHGIRKGIKLWNKIAQIPGIRAICSNGEMTKEQVVSGTKRADLVFISSKEEGGPMTLTEALACGTRVLAPSDVGFCDEWGDVVLNYKKGDFISAKEKILSLLEEKRKGPEKVKHLTWDNWCQAHYQLFRKVLSENE